MIKSSFDIPYTNFSGEVQPIKKELMNTFEAVLESGQYILGSEVEALENEFATYCGVRGAVSVGSGTGALYLVLRGLGLTEGQEVITAPNSFIASAASIALTGACPVFVDVRPDGNIDPERIEAAITPRTKAILPVHITGRPARMPEILDIAKRHHLFVVEDAAQAVGAKLDGRPVGCWGDAACFSLHPLKNLHVFGDGGMITTDNAELLGQMVKARNHGLVNRDQCDAWSVNCKLDAIQAALLRIQMRYLEERTEVRRQLAFRYNDILRSHVDVPDEGPGECCVFQTYVARVEKRDDLQRYLREHGVEALVHYATPIHLQPAAKSLGHSESDFPNTMHYVNRILSLPLYPGLTHAQQDRVVELIVAFYQTHA
ncbi:MAG TPA: DegT/DnrJ/EryC1/StrS family aminotransferase [Nitrospirales bacterium]|nr:DegT/DnrJ/EryC1/StrS family aminotransferase [Nitrospirales bacterium]